MEATKVKNKLYRSRVINIVDIDEMTENKKLIDCTGRDWIAASSKLILHELKTNIMTIKGDN